MRGESLLVQEQMLPWRIRCPQTCVGRGVGGIGGITCVQARWGGERRTLTVLLLFLVVTGK